MAEPASIPNGQPEAPPNPRRYPSLAVETRRIRDLRHARKLTQLQLAMAAGVSERTVRAAETGKQVRMDSLKGIATALGVELSDLVAGADQLRSAHIGSERVDRLLNALRMYVDEFEIGELSQLFAANGSIEIFGDEKIPFTGEYHGVDGIQTLRERVDATSEYACPSEINEIRGSGDFVVIAGVDTLRSKATGRQDRAAWQHVYEFENERVVRLRETFDTLKVYHLYNDPLERAEPDGGNLDGK